MEEGRESERGEMSLNLLLLDYGEQSCGRCVESLALKKDVQYEADVAKDAFHMYFFARCLS